MIVNNGKKLFAAWFFDYSGGVNASSLVGISGSALSGGQVWKGAYTNYDTTLASGYSYGSGTMWCGTDDTPEDESDYSIVKANLTCTSISKVTTDTSGVVTATFANNTGSDITVKEVALVSSVSGTEATAFIMIRNVLEAPVTVAAGANATFSIEINY